ncbi:MAG: hypothetical protein ACRDFS_01175 [Chloroflexota bacterium]
MTVFLTKGAFGAMVQVGSYYRAFDPSKIAGLTRTIAARIPAQGQRAFLDARPDEGKLLPTCLALRDVPKGFVQEESRSLNVARVIEEGGPGLTDAEFGWRDGCRSRFRRLASAQSPRGLYFIDDTVGRFQPKKGAVRWYAQYSRGQTRGKWMGARFRLIRSLPQRHGRASVYSATGNDRGYRVTSVVILLTRPPFIVYVGAEGFGKVSATKVVAMARTMDARLPGNA